jgi:hypothetical protein
MKCSRKCWVAGSKKKPPMAESNHTLFVSRCNKIAA